MKKALILIFALLVLLACSKRSKNPQEDPFYTSKGEYDVSRFPLVKPYEMVSYTRDKWFIQSEDSDTSENVETIPGAKYINVVDSAIFAYSKNTIIVGQKAKEWWFVVVPPKHILRGFKTKKDYLKYLDSIKVKSPKMYDVEEVFHYFDRNDTLDWKKLNLTY